MANLETRDVLTALGALALCTIILRILGFLYLHTRRSSIKRYLRSSEPTWALVTGASDGIGLEFAKHLSKAGFNVVLHGRNPEKLARVKSNLQTLHPSTKYEIVIADASKSHGMKSRIAEIVSVVKILDGPLTVLVNNVGGGGNMPRVYNSFTQEMNAAQIDEVLNMNARFTIQLTRALLPGLIKQAPALVMSVSSTASVIGAPYFAVYSGSKACVDRWTMALRREMKLEGRDVEVLSVIAGLVTSTAWLRVGASLFVPDARTFAASALRKEASIRWLPGWFGDWVIGVAVTGYRDAETKTL